jgi:hypothetical protein
MAVYFLLELLKYFNYKVNLFTQIRLNHSESFLNRQCTANYCITFIGSSTNVIFSSDNALSFEESGGKHIEWGEPKYLNKPWRFCLTRNINRIF